MDMDLDLDEEHAEPKQTKKKQNPVDPSIQCLFSRRPCKRKRLRGFDFCHKHILEDKNSPFQQCSFIIKSSEERCTNPAPKADGKKTFCLIHTRDPKLKKAHDEIMRRNLKRKLAQRKSEGKKTSTEAPTVSSTHKSSQESKRARDEEPDQFGGLEMSESDGIYALKDNGDLRYDVAWFDENESDAESVDSEEEDPLRHACVWTLEESLKICRDKMIRKRSLYLEQYKRLHTLLRERRRKHLIRMATASYDIEQPVERNDDGKGQLTFSEQRALGLYQHINGIEALLERQAKEKRSRGSTTVLKSLPLNRCQYIDEQQRCQNNVLPFSKFCLPHICFDPDQWLYKNCSFETAGSDGCCIEPVPQISRTNTCDLHAIPLRRFASEALENIINPVENRESEITNQDIETTSSETPSEIKSQEDGDVDKTGKKENAPVSNIDSKMETLATIDGEGKNADLRDSSTGNDANVDSSISNRNGSSKKEQDLSMADMQTTSVPDTEDCSIPKGKDTSKILSAMPDEKNVKPNSTSKLDCDSPKGDNASKKLNVMLDERIVDSDSLSAAKTVESKGGGDSTKPREDEAMDSRSALMPETLTSGSPRGPNASKETNQLADASSIELMIKKHKQASDCHADKILDSKNDKFGMTAEINTDEKKENCKDVVKEAKCPSDVIEKSLITGEDSHPDSKIHQEMTTLKEPSSTCESTEKADRRSSENYEDSVKSLSIDQIKNVCSKRD